MIVFGAGSKTKLLTFAAGYTCAARAARSSIIPEKKNTTNSCCTSLAILMRQGPPCAKVCRRFVV